MNPSRTSWLDPSGVIAASSFLACAMAIGLLTEDAKFGLRNPRLWLPDLLVGIALVAFGLFALRLQRGVGVLLVAAGLTWWLGNLAPAILYVHRGLMLHAVGTYPGWRTRRSVGTSLLIMGYLFACWVPLASSDLGTAFFGMVVMAVGSLRLFGSMTRLRRPRRPAFEAGVALLLGSTGSVLVRVITGSVEAIEPALFIYELGLVAAAAVLALGLRTPSPGSLADLVVEIGESGAATVRDAMARLLGDPLLQVGVRQADGSYLDTEGAPIDLPDESSPRTATPVGQGTPGAAVIVHDRAVLADRPLLEAVASVTRLSSVNEELTAEARQRLTQLTAARRRLLTSEDEERRRLARSLEERTGSNLTHVEEVLVSILASMSGGPTLNQAAQDALDQLRLARADLDTIAQGLQPFESRRDLETALDSMAAQAPLPVSVKVAALPERHEVASAIYYLCSEAIANTVKHSSAERVEIELIERDRVLNASVMDDGAGGADPNKGTGLEGLMDRVAGLGGELVIESPRGSGTRLTARFRLDGDM